MTIEATFEWEARIPERAARCGIELDADRVALLAGHARAVLRESDELHLTSISDPLEFLERHLGESFEGAALLPPEVRGLLLDVGSGNGYPALPFAAARPGLDVILTEASQRKARFLRQIVNAVGWNRVSVLDAQIQRAGDLYDIEPIRVLTTRGMGGWPKVVPRLASCLADDGEALIWAGEETDKIASRVVWRRYELVRRRALPDRERSWVFLFRKARG